MGIRVTSYRVAGRLVPPSAKGLRAGSIILRRDGVMDWHSTHAREELLIVLASRVHLEVVATSRRLRRFPLTAGQCAWLPSHTLHRVVNPSPATARYLYVTAPIVSERRKTRANDSTAR